MLKKAKCLQEFAEQFSGISLINIQLAKRSEDCLTTTSLSRLFAQRQCSALTGGASWFPSALLNVPWRLGERAICCSACFLSLLPIDLANCCQFCMALTPSCYVTEGFGMVLLPLLRLLYGP